MGSEVAVLYCDTYEEEAVYQKLRRGLELLGGLERFVSPREKILLKPNLVRRAENDRGSGHPSGGGGGHGQASAGGRLRADLVRGIPVESVPP